MDPIRRSTREALQSCGLEAFVVGGENTAAVVCRRGDTKKLCREFLQKALVAPTTKRSASEPLDFVAFFVNSVEASEKVVSMILIMMMPRFSRYSGCAVWLQRGHLTETDIEAAASRLLKSK